MRVAFFGSGSFATPILRAIAPSVALVVSQPDRPTGRRGALTPTPVAALAREMVLPTETPERSRAPEFVARLREGGFDALIVASYGQILSQAVLDCGRAGAFNLHGSILPAWRGAAPIQRAILARDPETGVALMLMDRGMDTGAVIETRTTAIGPDETYGELQDRLGEIAAAQTAEWLPRLVAGEFAAAPQDHARATLAPKVEKAEAALSPARDVLDEYARFRAFTPSPGPFLTTPQGPLRLEDVRPGDERGEPGVILSLDPLVVGWSGGAMILRRVRPGGKTGMSGRDYANGARLRPGERWLGE